MKQTDETEIEKMCVLLLTFQYLNLVLIIGNRLMYCNNKKCVFNKDYLILP